MNILVAYAGWTGSTQGIAEAIGQTLAAHHLDVDVRPVTQVESVSGYDAVVLGDAIRAAKPHPAAIAFARKHRAALASVPVACFAVCALLSSDTAENRRTAATYLDALREFVTPVAAVPFAGAMFPERMAWWLRLMMKFMKSPQGDFRDWNAIRAWAETLPAALGVSRTPAGATADIAGSGY